MKFVGISQEDLNDLHRSLEIFEQVYGNGSETFRPFLYVLVNQGGLLDLASQAIRDGGDYEEQDPSPKPAAVAIALQLSSDVLHYLLGSGLMVGDAKEDFAYLTDGEGVRTSTFAYAGSRDRLSLNQVVAFAISEDDTYLDEFFMAHGPKSQTIEAEAPPVERSQSVTQSKGLLASSTKGVDRILIPGKSVRELKVTEIIEISDFVMDHPRGIYLYADINGAEWLFYSKDPQEGKAAVKRMLMMKYDLDDQPEVHEWNSEDVKGILEGMADEELGKG